MILSDAFPFQFRDQPATLYVIRNDGFCWGEIETAAGERLSVDTDEDQYERIDEDAAAAFIAAAADPQRLSPSLLGDA